MNRPDGTHTSLRVTDEMAERAYRAWSEAVRRPDAAPGNREAIRIALEAALSTPHAEGWVPQEWPYCPECGSDKVRRVDGPHKQCARCEQEWYADVDYTMSVRENLAEKSAEIERLWSALATANDQLAAIPPKDSTNG